jgi:hypothetical protein
VPRKPRDYKAEYARRIRNAEARGLTRSQARGHPKRKELSATEVREGRKRSRRKVPAKPPTAAAQSLEAGDVSMEQLRELQRWRESLPSDAWWQVMAGPLGLSLDMEVLLGSLDVSPRSITGISVKGAPGRPNDWLVIFEVRNGKPRYGYVAKTGENVAQLRRIFTGPSPIDGAGEIEIDVESP